MPTLGRPESIHRCILLSRFVGATARAVARREIKYAVSYTFGSRTITIGRVTKKLFRFAVQATNAAGAREWRDTARQVEDLGYSTLFLADHCLGPGPAQRIANTPRQDLAPIAAMATAAAVTETLRVGCRVFCVDYHSPAVLAKEAATLDLLSDGRLELGIGAGWSEAEYRAMGIEFNRPGERIDKLKEVVVLLRAHYSGDAIACKGQYVNVAGYVGTPMPVQRPHPPIMIGGGRKRVLSYAGREADIVSINTVPFVAHNDDGLSPSAEAARRLDYVRVAAGERFASLDIESSPYFVKVTKDRDDQTDALNRLSAAMGTPPELLRDHPNVLTGSVDQIAETLQSRRESFGVNYVTVQQSRIQTFAPVVERLRGS
jgi:probable F420-dependent oxidoreductase